MLHDDAGTPTPKPRHALIQKLTDPKNLKNFLLLHSASSNEATLIYPIAEIATWLRLKVFSPEEFKEWLKDAISLQHMGEEAGYVSVFEKAPTLDILKESKELISAIDDLFFKTPTLSINDAKILLGIGSLKLSEHSDIFLELSTGEVMQVATSNPMLGP